MPALVALHGAVAEQLTGDLKEGLFQHDGRIELVFHQFHIPLTLLKEGGNAFNHSRIYLNQILTLAGNDHYLGIRLDKSLNQVDKFTRKRLKY